MGIEVKVTRGSAANKPPHGAPCNQCGLCCQASRCPLAQFVFKLPEIGRCPALSYDADGLSVCGLVAEPQTHAPFVVMRWGIEVVRTAARHLIGSGLGCDARINGEVPDQAFYARLREHDCRNARRTKTSLKIWGRT